MGKGKEFELFISFCATLFSQNLSNPKNRLSHVLGNVLGLAQSLIVLITTLNFLLQKIKALSVLGNIDTFKYGHNSE